MVQATIDNAVVSQTVYEDNFQIDSPSLLGSGSVSGQTSGVSGFEFGDSGNKLYATTSSGNSDGRVLEYNLSTPYDVSTATFVQDSMIIGGNDDSIGDLTFKDDGTKVWIASKDFGGSIYEWTLSTAWDISTASETANVSYGTPDGIAIGDSGTKLYVSENGTSGNITQWDLTTPYDLSTRTNQQSITLSGLSDGRGIDIDSVGKRFFVVDSGDETIKEYEMSTEWDITSSIGQTSSGDISGNTSNQKGLDFNPKGDIMGLSDGSSSTYSYNLPYSKSTFTVPSGETYRITVTGNNRVGGVKINGVRVGESEQVVTGGDTVEAILPEFISGYKVN